MFAFTFACVLYIIVCMYTYVHACLCTMYMYVYVYAFVLQFVAVAAIINVTLIVSSTTATLECTLPCFSPNLWCNLSITPINGELITHYQVMESRRNFMLSYPTQQIVISNLASDRSYNYCVVVINATNNMTVGDPVCDSFTTAGTYM